MKLVISTERLILREYETKDATFVVELLNTPGFLNYIGDRKVRTHEEGVNYINHRIKASYTKNAYGMWIVCLKNDHTPIGTCGLVNREDIEEIDIGFAFLPLYMGKGYGYESASAVMDYAQNTLKIKNLAAIVNANNSISKSLLAKLGFTFNKIVRLKDGSEVEFMLSS